MLFDSHAHLDDERFSDDRDAVINRLTRNGISKVINVGSSIEHSRAVLDLAHKYPQFYAACGVHPHETQDLNEQDLAEVVEMLDDPKTVAMGEIGLDFFYDHSDRDLQRKWFEEQLIIAKRLDKPVIIHDRDAHSECFDLVKKHGVRGVFHCYTGSAEMAKELLKIGFYISFTGVITFKNAVKAIEALQVVPLDRLLVETDCPYLSPEPYRGKRNEPSNVKYVAQKMASVKKISLEELSNITFENTCRLFNIEK